MRNYAALILLLAGCGGQLDGTPAGGDPGSPAGDSANVSGTPSLEEPGVAAKPSSSPSPSPSPSPAADPCAKEQYGDGGYCGGSIGGDPNTLYECKGGHTASKTVCAMGCHPAPPGVNDYCNDNGLYHLPWHCGGRYTTTQGNNGDICGGGTGDHTGVQAYAWDWGLPRHTPVAASRAGTVTVAANVTGPGQGCYDGCTQPFGTSAFWACCNSCINTSNHVNIQHADGHVSTYWHLDVATVHVGQVVNAGDIIGYSGTSGCSSGPHIHFQVMGNCPTGYCQSVPVSLAGAGVPACGAAVTSDNGC